MKPLSLLFFRIDFDGHKETFMVFYEFISRLTITSIIVSVKTAQTVQELFCVMNKEISGR